MCNLGVRALSLGLGLPPPGHTPAAAAPAAPTPPGAARAGIAHLHRKPVRRPAGSGSRGWAGLRRRELGPCRLGGSPPRAAEGRVRRAAAEPGRQEEEEDSGRSALRRSTLLLAALQQPPQITSGALGERGGAGWGATSCVWAGRRVSGAGAGEQWPGGQGLAGVRPRRAESWLRCPSDRPAPGSPRPARWSRLLGVGSCRRPRGGSRISASAPRRPRLRSGDPEGVLGERGESGGRHLAFGGRGFSLVVQGWRPLRPGAGFSRVELATWLVAGGILGAPLAGGFR